MGEGDRQAVGEGEVYNLEKEREMTVGEGEVHNRKKGRTAGAGDGQEC